MDGIYIRSQLRELYYIKAYCIIFKKVFKIDVNPETVIYEWQVSHHDIYTVNDQNKVHGVFMTINNYRRLIRICIVDNGEIKIDIDPSTLIID
jgi:AMMECR1 domain-containing protein